MREYLKIFQQVIFWLLIIVIQLGFISSLKAPFYNIPLLLVCFSFFIIFQKKNNLLYRLIAIGFLLDIYSFDIFPFFTVSFLVSAVILKFIQVNFLTTKSLYSILSLTSLYLLFFNIIFRFLSMFVSFFSLKINWFLFSSIFWQDIFFQLLFNFVITIIFFYFTKLTSKKLSSDFLKR